MLTTSMLAALKAQNSNLKSSWINWMDGTRLLPPSSLYMMADNISSCYTNQQTYIGTPEGYRHWVAEWLSANKNVIIMIVHQHGKTFVSNFNDNVISKDDILVFSSKRCVLFWNKSKKVLKSVHRYKLAGKFGEPQKFSHKTCRTISKEMFHKAQYKYVPRNPESEKPVVDGSSTESKPETESDKVRKGHPELVSKDTKRTTYPNFAKFDYSDIEFIDGDPVTWKSLGTDGSSYELTATPCKAVYRVPSGTDLHLQYVRVAVETTPKDYHRSAVKKAMGVLGYSMKWGESASGNVVTSIWYPTASMRPYLKAAFGDTYSY